MDDNNDSQLPAPSRGTGLTTKSEAQLPDMGGVVNRWLDRFRTLDNQARKELVSSLSARINAEGELIDAYISFERKKQQLYFIDEILDDEEEEILEGLAEKKHQRELRKKQRERELNELDPEPEQTTKRHARNRKPRKSEMERMQEEAEMIARHGTPDQRGIVADAQINSIREQYGDDDTTWPNEVRENARRLELWKLQNK